MNHQFPGISRAVLPLLLILSGTVSAQEIAGTIVAANRTPVPFANAILLSVSDSVMIKGGVAAEKKFKDGGSLRASVDDLFYTNGRWRINTSIPENNINTRVVYDWHARYVRLTYTRILGNKKLKSVKLQSGSEEERNRVSN